MEFLMPVNRGCRTGCSTTAFNGVATRSGGGGGASKKKAPAAKRNAKKKPTKKKPAAADGRPKKAVKKVTTKKVTKTTKAAAAGRPKKTVKKKVTKKKTTKKKTRAVGVNQFSISEPRWNSNKKAYTCSVKRESAAGKPYYVSLANTPKSWKDVLQKIKAKRDKACTDKKKTVAFHNLKVRRDHSARRAAAAKKYPYFKKGDKGKQYSGMSTAIKRSKYA